MANFTEESVWEDGIYRLETTDPVLGGEGGVSNIQAQQLANRTKYLKDLIDAIQESLGDAIPSGAVMPFARNTPPPGWLKCDGSEISRETYANLFDAIGTTFGAGDGSTTFKLPDLRAEFVRGWDDGRNVDTGRAFGSSQNDAFQGHHHNLSYNYTGAVGGSLEIALNTSASSNIKSNTAANPISDSTNGTPRTASETRPRNVALLYCIKI